MDLSARRVDGMVPARVERPPDAAALAALVGEAHRERRAVVLWGGGTRIEIGDAPERYDVAVDLTGMSGMVEHSPADMVCTVRTGTTISELDRELARAGQRWPVTVGDPGRATVGGTIASAAPDPSRLRHQHVRDWVIGCEAVVGDGTRARAGGRVAKNVTGYDLTRLYSGSYGTLAALTEVSLKLVARDEAAEVLHITGGDLARIAGELRADLPLDGLVLVAGRSAGLFVRVAGSAAAVRRLRAEVGRRSRYDVVDDEAWSKLVALPVHSARVARISVAPGREPEHMSGDAIAYVGTGIVYRFGASLAELRAARERAEAAGGSLVLERAPLADKEALGVWGRTRIPQAVARALRERFDPRGVLSPGRVP